MKKIVLLAAIALASPVAYAADAKPAKPQGSGPNPYVECGIGAALFPSTQWAAVLSNAIWDLGTTAVTSALSSPETCNAKKVKTAKLILETLPALEADIANGGGANTAALASTMGCSSQQAAITSGLRARYAAVVAAPVYSTQTRVERAAGLYSTLKTMAATTCTTTL